MSVGMAARPAEESFWSTPMVGLLSLSSDWQTPAPVQEEEQRGRQYEQTYTAQG